MSNKPEIYFYKGSTNKIDESKSASDKNQSEIEKIKIIRNEINKIIDGKNLSFLLGAGCSSYKINDKGQEVGIPTMLELAMMFYQELDEDYKKKLKDKFSIDVLEDKFASDLEFFLGNLFSIKYILENRTQNKDNKDKLEIIQNIIKEIKKFLIKTIQNEENKKNEQDKPLSQIYEKFYKKLLYRSSNLIKPNIFTTNYDLYSETTMDKLGIHYVNGFAGGINKHFNPTIFNYTLAEKMDLSHNKWNSIDNFFYLYKLHGSVNWIEDDSHSKLFRVKEIQEELIDSDGDLAKSVMIYPTPLKQNESLGSPYSDLFREFQKKLMQHNNILVTVGYSFRDEHINNLIYQAFTIPSFRLIIIGDCNQSEIEKLKSLEDPRIWIIGGKLKNNENLHYFKNFVEQILPDLDDDEIDIKIENAVKTLFKVAEK